eukprot:scaffold11822_cov120-Isochrysis_galbana.AAC.12
MVPRLRWLYMVMRGFPRINKPIFVGEHILVQAVKPFRRAFAPGGVRGTGSPRPLWPALKSSDSESQPSLRSKITQPPTLHRV